MSLNEICTVICRLCRNPDDYTKFSQLSLGAIKRSHPFAANMLKTELKKDLKVDGFIADFVYLIQMESADNIYGSVLEIANVLYTSKPDFGGYGTPSKYHLDVLTRIIN